MTAQPIATAPTSGLIPATFTHGRRVGTTTEKVLVNPVTGTHFCPDCDYTAERFSQVFAHRRAHAKPKAKRTTAAAGIQERLNEAAEIIAAIQQEVDTPATEATVPAEWKTRALSAEKQLKSLRRILGTDNT